MRNYTPDVSTNWVSFRQQKSITSINWRRSLKSSSKTNSGCVLSSTVPYPKWTIIRSRREKSTKSTRTILYGITQVTTVVDVGLT